MNRNILVIRAVAAEFAQRIYTPVLITAIIVAVLLVVLSIWLVTLSAWWWILAVLMYLGIIIAGVVLIIVKVVIATVRPRQSKTQKTAIKTFVDKLQTLSEITQTPKVILLFRVLRDAVSSKKGGFVEATIQHTTSLRQDYVDLLNLFSE